MDSISLALVQKPPSDAPLPIMPMHGGAAPSGSPAAPSVLDPPFGAIIDQAIQVVGSQNALARRLGVPYQALQAYRRGKRTPTLCTLLRVVSVLGGRVVVQFPEDV